MNCHGAMRQPRSRAARAPLPRERRGRARTRARPPDVEVAPTRSRSGSLSAMDEATVKAMLMQHFEYAGSDPDRAHDMYHDDAVLEFPQSGELFLGVGPSGNGDAPIRRRRPTRFGKSEAVMISGSRRCRSATTRVLGTSGSASSSFVGTGSRVSRSTSPRAGIHQSGGRSGGPRLRPARSRWASPPEKRTPALLGLPGVRPERVSPAGRGFLTYSVCGC
jgi:hypothetical protein